MKLKYLLSALALALAILSGCATAEKASYNNSSSPAESQTEQNSQNSQNAQDTQQTNDTPTDTTILNENENIESENISESDSDSMDISADWAENVIDTVTDYEEIIIDDYDYAMNIMFTAANPVSSFKIISVEYADFQEDGTPIFLTDTIYNYGELDKGQSLMVKLGFPGDMPSYGISYIDINGVEKQYALQQSGKDGSLIMIEFD